VGVVGRGRRWLWKAEVRGVDARAWGGAGPPRGCCVRFPLVRIGSDLNVLKESLAKLREVETVSVGELIERLGPGMRGTCAGDAQELVDRLWVRY
jgi:hypothetical protein